MKTKSHVINYVTVYFEKFDYYHNEISKKFNFN